MPELPEVQTVVADLNRKIVGEIITDFWSDWPSAIKNVDGGKSASSADKFKKEIKNRKILGVRRIGKNIFIDLSGGKTLYIHLKMTGHLLIKSQFPNPKSQTNLKSKIQKSKQGDYFSDKVNQYIHHIWKLRTTNHKLQTIEFSDVRKFAKIVLDDTKKISELPEIKKLGLDAMNSRLTLKKFREILSQKKNKAIGLALMDQEVIAGIGNIYRSEILFAAGLQPTKMVKVLSKKEWQELYGAMRKVLKKAIKMRGTSESDYRDTAGAPGSFQKALRVYKKNGKKCPNCGIIIKRQILGQRSLFFCSKCQK